jgi:hypothetical protein
MDSHLEIVFVYRGHPASRMNDSAFGNARARVAEKLPNIKNASIHSLKHTYGARLRVAGVPEEDRDFLTGHKGRMSVKIMKVKGYCITVVISHVDSSFIVTKLLFGINCSRKTKYKSKHE